jgi:hypothetical protein
MLGRRLLVLMAVLLGLTALATALAPRPTVVPQRGSVTASPSAAPSASSPGLVASRIVTQTVDADAGARPSRVRAHAGDTIRLSVRGDVLDAVELQGLGEIKPLEPGSPAHFELLADATGDFPIVLQQADRRVGLIHILPRER